MTDSELLEAADRAAGIGGEWNERGQCIHVTGVTGMSDVWWRPLDDDGDALRLAVKLQLQITPGTYNKDEFTAFHAGHGEAHEFANFQQDEFAATRRAIVRAAAEIGRTKS